MLPSAGAAKGGPEQQALKEGGSMTEPREKVLHLTKDVVLPLGMVLALVSFSYNFGSWKVDKEIKIEQALALAKANATVQAAVNLRLFGIENRLKGLEKDGEIRDREDRRFRTFAKGRIARLPWRAADAD